MSIAERVQEVKKQIARAAEAAGRNPEEVTLEAATKTQSTETIREAIEAGICVCGENRVQELTAHLSDGAYDGAQLHFIGHLQTNKVKYIVGKVDLIESVSSEKLLDAIQEQAAKVETVQDILLEVNIGREDSKSGFLPEEVADAARKAAQLSHIRLRGLMAIPPVAELKGQNLPYFLEMNQLFVDIRTIMREEDVRADILSMGMSGDYEDAVAAGATLVRIGSGLFGPRS